VSESVFPIYDLNTLEFMTIIGINRGKLYSHGSWNSALAFQLFFLVLFHVPVSFDLCVNLLEGVYGLFI